jgi:hypothetical protein
MDIATIRLLILAIGLLTYFGGWLVALSNPNMKNYSAGHWATVIALVLAAPVLLGFIANGGG